MPNSTHLTFMGIGKETVPGTGVPATAFIPISAPTVKDDIKRLEDKGLRGSMVEMYNEVAGVQSGSFDFGGDVFPDTFGWLVAGVLGDVATVGAAAPYTHSIAVLNSGQGQPTSYSLTDYYAVTARQYAGAKFSELSLKFSADGMLTYSTKATTYGSAVVTKPTAAFTSVQPLAGWVGAVSIGGTAALNVMDGEVSIKRPVTVIHTVDGNQAPSQLWSGPVSVEGKMTLVMEDDTQLTNYLTNSQPALDINYASGTGAAAVQVKLHMTSVVYSTADITRGKDFVELSVAFKARANSTDIGASAGFSPIKVTIQNAVATGVYA